MIKLEQKDDVDPLCPHCSEKLQEVWHRELSGLFGKRQGKGSTDERPLPVAPDDGWDSVTPCTPSECDFCAAISSAHRLAHGMTVIMLPYDVDH